MKIMKKKDEKKREREKEDTSMIFDLDDHWDRMR